MKSFDKQPLYLIYVNAI